MTKNYNEFYNTLANNNNVSRSQVYIRCLIKAVRAKNEDKLGVAQSLLKLAFTPPTNTKKVANGALNYWGYNHARTEAYYFIRIEIAEFLTEEENNILQDINTDLRNWKF